MDLIAAVEKKRELVAGFPAVVITGPRQSGKKNMIKTLFPSKQYFLFWETLHS